MSRLVKFVFVIALFLTLIGSVSAENYLETLQENQIVNGFKTVSIYDNAEGKAMGGRFVSDKFGYIIDLLQIQSVPQAFFWVKTPPATSKGEPHACEHLLLGKGNRGRYVAAMEDMALANSTAYTAQTRTCYHFNTIAGEDTFYKIFEAKLQALLHPDFSDEEIRREVCHVGVNEDTETGELSIDEKGTVYTEMVSSFEKPWYHTWGALNRMIYGEDHPLINNSGGDPDVMRSMVPDDMWKFIKETHHLGNMGAVVSIPSEISVESFLAEMNNIMNRCQDFEETWDEASIRVKNIPPGQMASEGTTKIVNFPSDNPEDPGSLLFAWPAVLKMDQNEQAMLDMFLTGLAGGQTSNLYKLFINSATKQIDIGGSYIYGGFDNDIDVSIFFSIGGVDNSAVDEATLQKARDLILSEIEKVAAYPDSSDELKEFNQRINSSLIQYRKQIGDYLNAPPMFGFRGGPAGRWVSHLIDVEQLDQFRKPLTLKPLMDYIEAELSKSENIWRDRIEGWKVLTTAPYMVGAKPDPSILAKKAEAKAKRIDGYIEGFKTKYGVEDAQQAIAKYKEEFDANTAILKASASKDKLPGFIDNPPMTIDDQLVYEAHSFDNNIDFVASSFDNMTSGNFGIAFNMADIPREMFVYLPFLPSVFTSLGVIENDVVVPFDEMQQRLKQEVLSYSAYYNFGLETNRIELLFNGRGSNLVETKNSIDWIETALYNPYLTIDNIDRIKDVINQSLMSYRNRTKGSEEGWVNNPANAYRYQDNPLFLATYSFLTQSNLMLNLKYRFMDADDEFEQVAAFIDQLKTNGLESDRDNLNALIESFSTEPVDALKADYDALSDASKEIVNEIVKDIKVTLIDIPDKNLYEDFDFLCESIKSNLAYKPKTAIDDISQLLKLIRCSDRARTYMISNKTTRQKLSGRITELIRHLDTTPTIPVEYNKSLTVVERLKSREDILDKPVYAGLMFNGTSNGVLIFTARNALSYDQRDENLLVGMAGKLYTGYGPHGLFMKTWAAGLAYSNGYRFYEKTGMARYYAERCPDVAETMRFVVNELKNAPYDSSLANYAVAQAFGESRAQSRYEQRGSSMAADLTDGYESDRVKSYRQKILEIKEDTEFYDKIHNRMEAAYGSVMIGYGKPLAESNDGIFFLIGPEKQFKSLENYIESTEGKQTVFRLYPRDFWLTN